MKSPYFKPSEFQCKCSYEDCINSHQCMDERFLELIFKIRAQVDFPMAISSGYRCEKHNRDVGGVKNSNHTKGLAVDVLLSNQYDRYDLVEQCIAHGLSMVVYPNFIHIELRKGVPRLSIKM